MLRILGMLRMSSRRNPRKGNAIIEFGIAFPVIVLVMADEKLFVVTREGQIYAFSGKAKAEIVTHQKPASSFASEDEWTEKAATILQETGVHDGYALVTGVGTCRLAEELVRQSECHVIVVDEDPEKVALLRDKFHSTGQYGSRTRGPPARCCAHGRRSAGRHRS